MNRSSKFFLLSVLIIYATALSAQKRFKSFGPNFCDSIKEISEAYYDLHQIKSNVLDTSNIPPKKGSSILIALGKDSLKFEDLEDADQGISISEVVGLDKKRQWVLVKSMDEIKDYYYFIDQKKGIVDTLIGYPYLYGDKLICIEGSHTDMPAYVEVW